MKRIVIALGLAVATLGFTGTASAQYRGGYSRGSNLNYSNFHRSYGGGVYSPDISSYRYNPGWYRYSYSPGFSYGYQPGLGYGSGFLYSRPIPAYGWSYPSYRHGGMPRYGYSVPSTGFGYPPGFSFGISR